MTKALGDRFLIERELGRGGMATVYLAQDLKHGRPVAIKVLRPELAASVGAERFLREIRTAARLQHPHILALHDSGEAGGQLYYVMPYVEGESLRDRLNRERQLPLDEALRITREVADALAYAHSHDVVHRDIKPENILFSGTKGANTGGSHALVSDFGIARAISDASGDTLTQIGMAVGTPSYMSPEQATAERAIDGRTDTYALGCVLYEMLAGHPPFLGSTAQEILARHSLDAVPPLRTTRPDLPEFVERALGKALAKSPADRYATTAAFHAALALPNPALLKAPRTRRRMVLGAAVVGVLVAGYVLVRAVRPPSDRRATDAAASAPSIAVLPFTNVGGDSTNEPYSDGIADELTTALGKIEGLNVIARTSAFKLKKETSLDAREIGQKLQVRYVVEGSVQRAENRRRVRAHLFDVTSGREVWSDNFEHDALNRDVFTVQDSIIRSIVRQLLPRIPRAAIASSLKRSTESPQAHDLYLQGRFFFEKRSAASLARAQNYFERAIEKDSSYALAYAGLSEVYSHLAIDVQGSPPRVSFSRAKAHAARALALDSTLAEVHSALAFIALWYDWDWAAAGREFEKALNLNPAYSPAHRFHAFYYLATDSVSAAIGEARLAVQLDPFSNLSNTRLISILYHAGRYREALDQALKTFELDSNFLGVRTELARVYMRLDRCEEALAALARGPDLQGSRGYVYARCGRPAQALAELDQFRAQGRAGEYVAHYGLAVIQAGLGNKEQAFAQLDSAYTERDWTMFLLKRDPAFEGLRSDPRFAVLVKKVGLVP